MNILQVSKHFSYSGVTTHIIDLSRELQRRGNKVVILTSGGPLIKKLEEEGLKYYLLPFTSLNPFKMIRNLFSVCKIIKEEKIDIAHTHWRSIGIYLKIASLFKKFKFVWTNHLNHIPTDFVRRNLTFYGNKALTVSTDMVKMLNEEIKIPMDKIKVVFNGIYENKYIHYDEDRIKELKEKYNIENCKVISLIGRLDPVKGHMFLIDALSEMEKNIHYKDDWRLLITGKDTNIEYKNAIISKAKELNLFDKIEFVGYANPVDILNVTDLMVLPSTNEGFPIVCVEAFSMKVPVVRTKTGGYNDMKELCFGVDYGDKEALSFLIAKCLSYDDEVNEKVEKAYEFFKTKLTNEQMVNQIANIYKDLLEEVNG